MAETAFQALINLVDFDQKTHALENDIQKIKKEIEDLNEKKSSIEAEIQNVKYLLKDLQKEVDSGELEMKEFEQKEKEGKNPRIYVSY